MDKQGKRDIVKSLTENFQNSQIALCADYLGLTVEQISNLRNELRETGSSAKVVKNTLTKISFDDSFKEISDEDSSNFKNMLSGPSMMVFSDDPVSSSKVLAKYAKEHKVFELKGGWFEDKYIDVSVVEQLSNMPSKEELYGKLLNLINTPATLLARLIGTPGTKVAQVVKAYENKLKG